MNSGNAVTLQGTSRAVRAVWLGLFVAVIIGCLTTQSFAATGKLIANNTPPYVRTAANLGAANPATVIEVSFWLQPRNRPALDALAAQLYDPTSPKFRHFLTRKQIQNQFAPTWADLVTVRQFLEASNLKITHVGPMNFYVHARGTVGDIEK